jgi:hypothetical protein
MGVTKRIPTVKMAIFVFKDYSAPDKTLDKQHRTFTPGQSGGQAAGDNSDYGRESKNFKQTSYRIRQEAPSYKDSSPGASNNQGLAGDLTPRQFEVFRHMLAFQDENGRPPTQMELSTRLGMKSEQGVKAHLAILEAKGYIVAGQKFGHRNKMAMWPGSDRG